MTPIEIQMHNEFPNHDHYHYNGHGMDIDDIPESWFVKKGLSVGLNEETLEEAIQSKSLKAMATKAAKSTNYAAKEISKDVMPTDRITIPVERTVTQNPDIINHLKKHGYTIQGEYVKGLAVHHSNPNRPLRVGRILSATDAPQSLQKAWENDPARRGIISAPQTHVVISRHPYDVAAMSSGQHWESCQTLGQKDVVNPKTGEVQENGLYSKMVPGIIASGAHIAYHVHDPEDIDKNFKPIGRHTLNVYVSPTGHKILRPSEHYGDEWEGFSSTVKNWAEKNFPMKDAIYTRHQDAYPEGANTINNYAPEHDEYWKNNPDGYSINQHPSKDVLDHYVGLVKEGRIPAHILLQNKNITDEQQDKIIGNVLNSSSSLDSMRKLEDLAHYAPLSEKSISRILDKHPSYKTVKGLATQQNTSKDQLHEILDRYAAGQTNIPGLRRMPNEQHHLETQILERVAAHKNSDDSHFNKILELENFHPDHYNNLLKNEGKTIANVEKITNMIDHDYTLENIANRYHSEDIGRKLTNFLPRDDSTITTHKVIGNIAEKHPHLIDNSFSDRDITGAIKRRGFVNKYSNKNLVDIALRRGTKEPLKAVAGYSKDRDLLNKLAEHPDQEISNAAKINLMHLDQ